MTKVIAHPNSDICEVANGTGAGRLYVEVACQKIGDFCLLAPNGMGTIFLAGISRYKTAFLDNSSDPVS